MKKFLFLLLVFCPFAGLFAEEAVPLKHVKQTLREDSVRMVTYHKQVVAYYAQKEREQQQITEECNQVQLDVYSNKMSYIFYTTAKLKQFSNLERRLETLALPNQELVEYCSGEHSRLHMLKETLLHLAIFDSIPVDTILLPNPDYAERDTCLALLDGLLSRYEDALAWERNMHEYYIGLKSSMADTHAYVEDCMEKIRLTVFERRGHSFWSLLPHAGVLFLALLRGQDASGELGALKESGEFGFIWGMMFLMALLSIVVLCLMRKFKSRNVVYERVLRNPLIYANLLWVILCMIALLVSCFILHLPALTHAFPIFAVYVVFCVMLQVFLLLRETGDRASKAMRLYAPALFLGFCTIFFRLFLFPDVVLVLLTFPITFIAYIWQLITLRKYRYQAARFDRFFASITLFLLFAMTILSFVGYTFISLLVYNWLQAQAMCIIIAMGLYRALKRYENTVLAKRKMAWIEHHNTDSQYSDGTIHITWLFDLILMVGLPGLVIISLPFCVYFSLDYFHAGSRYVEYFYTNFYSFTGDDGELLQLSFHRLCLVTFLFFVFRYLSYVLREGYSWLVTVIEQIRSGRSFLVQNQVNHSIGVNIINIVMIALYLTSCCIILSIPTSALTFIFAGLATGIGFAMRDILNNLFYGIQLMAGRLHVGDYIVCGQYRGSVTSISYQTTQMKTEENAMVYFTNADLFSNNFQNLTRGNPYEVNRVFAEIAYGSDMKAAEAAIREAVESLNTVDKYGRPLLSAQEGLRFEVMDLADSGIRIAVRFAVIAEKRTWFLPVVREAMYEALSKAGIQIPFQQVDVHVLPDQSRSAE